METQARAGRLTDTEQWIDRIGDEYARVRAALPGACAQTQATSCHTDPQP